MYTKEQKERALKEFERLGSVHSQRRIVTTDYQT